MKVFILLLALTVVVLAAPKNKEQKEKKWKEFKQKNGKSFLNAEKEQLKKGRFLKRDDEIEEHNEKFAKGEVTYKKAHNEFSDLSDDEILRHHGGLAAPPPELRNVKDSERITLRQSPPASLDLRTVGGITPVRNQASCGSCWAFSTMSSMEHATWKTFGWTVDLSEQQLVDCVYNRDGCNGGWMPTAFDWLAYSSDGAEWESYYPYVASYQSCPSGLWGITLKTDKSYFSFGTDDTSIKNAINTYGNLAAVVDASGWGSYGGGIFQQANGANAQLNHAVNLIGYGTENGIPYWLIRNSWGTNWGEAGYMKLDARRFSNGVTYGGMFPQYLWYPNVNPVW